jgi:hypothetical protein
VLEENQRNLAEYLLQVEPNLVSVDKVFDWDFQRGKIPFHRFEPIDTYRRTTVDELEFKAANAGPIMDAASLESIDRRHYRLNRRRNQTSVVHKMTDPNSKEYVRWNGLENQDETKLLLVRAMNSKKSVGGALLLKMESQRRAPGVDIKKATKILHGEFMPSAYWLRDLVETDKDKPKIISKIEKKAAIPADFVEQDHAREMVNGRRKRRPPHLRTSRRPSGAATSRTSGQVTPL